ncbi:BPTI/Kunitz domain-containing protein [Spirosoma sp. KUDC1026]|uniref:BPTI/Kunitz domain-containing protein n=1 Tax=Spirosoma sp. KUDC1026 TaxID=2745947 RepID=UPI00159BDE3C|nr:BPTI/Kunitz domain-containing protein [Spirosoma sp. KUDC1026]QKZ13493.1 proteinase inhibitor I4 serpin [Spirosoma sp. KUDC1026]
MLLRRISRGLVLLTVVSGNISCERDYASSERCQLEPDSGPCYAYTIRYYCDKKEKRCKEFVYGGCGGTVPFETLAQCQECEK